MERLKKDSKQFHDILYVIWQLLEYYSNLFGYDAPECAHELNTTMFRDGTLTKIRVSVPRIKEFSTPYSVQDMRSIMNEYLSLLLQHSTLSPFSAGNSYDEVVEPLFITIIVTNGRYFDFDILYVDNMDAYHVAKENKIETSIKII